MLRFTKAAIALLLFASSVSFASSFDVTVSLEGSASNPLVRAAFYVPPEHHIYSDSIKLVVPEPAVLLPQDIPASVELDDPVLQQKSQVYEHDVALVYAVQNWTSDVLSVTVSYRGCNAESCFMPPRKTFNLVRSGATGATVVTPAPTQVVASGSVLTATDFRIRGTASGYLKSEPFVQFLETGRTTDTLRAVFERWGIWAYLLAVLVGGLALNFTPCILPMIPVNIAIIGAGASGGSKKRGFMLGTAYGIGIALVYGTLGLIFVRTSQRFGTLNSTPWFNLGIAVLFLLMALAMFGVINVDFSKYMTRVGPQPKESNRGRVIVAFLIGGVSALLAGACVAPVVISVLLLSTDLYSQGNPMAQLLPFAIGVGMALPWPFAGAGLSFLPKPGRWMERVKIGFGIIITLMALYYLKLGMSLLKISGSGEAVAGAAATHEGWYTAMEPALKEAREKKKPVFIDFWATWCKNCVKMNKTTFKDPEVQKCLKATVNVAIQAEDLEDPAIKGLLDQYNVVGLPTYVVLELK